jgi:hypothetical protein
MNLYFVHRTAARHARADGTILEGVTRSSILDARQGAGPGRRGAPDPIDGVARRRASGDITEVFACGTAAVITPVGRSAGTAARSARRRHAGRACRDQPAAVAARTCSTAARRTVHGWMRRRGLKAVHRSEPRPAVHRAPGPWQRPRTPRGLVGGRTRWPLAGRRTERIRCLRDRS